MFKLIIKVLKCLWFFVWGHIFALFYYDKTYLTGRHFQGKLKGLCSQGWVWAACDGFTRLVLRANTEVPWPVSYKTAIINPSNVIFCPDDLHIFHSYGTYFQGIGGKIVIGEGTWIAPNVGLITANHDTSNPHFHVPGKGITLGKKCWIGMNSVILPGVTLGDHTTVGAGTIVTKSFPEGFCVIAGNPAKVIRYIDGSPAEI